MSPTSAYQETFRTYGLLFPQLDSASKAIIKETAAPDTSFHSTYSGLSTGDETRKPQTIGDLYNKFPYWAHRLEALWEEVEHPRPVTWVERWVDKRKDQRWATWWVVIGLMLTALFGFLTTVLGALQVWISYRAWKDGN